MNALFGVVLHAIGGFASGSFYVPFKRVKGWAWESYWIISGYFAWLIMPWLVAWLTIPELWTVLSESPWHTLGWCYFFGVLWGIGGFTFGLTMRYLGLSLGMAVALGLCAAFGTIIPPLWNGQMAQLLTQASGQTVFGGVLLCLVGIGVCGWAGVMKEKDVPTEEVKKSIAEFDLKKGLFVAVVCGILSACFNFGVAAGEPLTVIAVAHGAKPLWKTGITYIPILLGGFTLNFIWCTVLNFRNKTFKDFSNSKVGLGNNYFFAALAGSIWYQQFMFYGMGTSFMDKFDFASWTLHMAFIIVFSTAWGIFFKEWKGISSKTKWTITGGLLIVILSTLIIGIGNSIGKSP